MDSQLHDHCRTLAHLHRGLPAHIGDCSLLYFGQDLCKDLVLHVARCWALHVAGGHLRLLHANAAASSAAAAHEKGVGIHV